MPTLLRVDASFRTEGSVSRAVADSAQSTWLEGHPSGTVVERDLGVAPLPSEAWGLAVGANWTPAEDRTPEQQQAQALAATLAEEILNADTVILAAPLYNYGINQYVKVWIDLLIADPRLGPGSTALAGKTMVLVIAQGGSYRDGTPKAGWDHATAYLERIFAENFGMEVATVTAELTMAKVNPAMADFVGISEQSLATAHAEASQHGTSLAARLTAAA